jgi:hypothetical protein
MESGERKQSTATYALFFWLISSSDHITGLTGKAGSVVVSLSKNGSSGVAPSGTISEVDATNQPGKYMISGAGLATDTNTLGELSIHAKDAASDPFDCQYDIVSYDPFAATVVTSGTSPGGSPNLANIALGRIGAKNTIVSLTETTPNAIKVRAVWDAVFREVLSERDWKFAKIRTSLVLSTIVPLYGYKYAWALPADFLRFVRPHKRPPNRFEYYWVNGQGWYHKSDPPLTPTGFPYVVETLSDGAKYVLIDYDGSYNSDTVMINYIQLISDYSRLMPGFVNCFCWRLAQELSIPITEDKNKFEMCRQEYKDALNSAEAQNEGLDFLENESGNNSWLTAGRW